MDKTKSNSYNSNVYSFFYNRLGYIFGGTSVGYVKSRSEIGSLGQPGAENRDTRRTAQKSSKGFEYSVKEVD